MKLKEYTSPVLTYYEAVRPDPKLTLNLQP